jgi:uncharacterized membrane protein
MALFYFLFLQVYLSAYFLYRGSLNTFSSTYPVFIWSFFFGLILASSIVILRGITGWNISLVIALISGILFAYLITSVTPAETPAGYWFIFLSGCHCHMCYDFTWHFRQFYSSFTWEISVYPKCSE